MKYVVPDRRVEAAALGEHDEQLEIALTVLHQVLPERSGVGGLHREAELPDEFFRKVGDGRLYERPRAVTLSQPVQRVIGPHDRLVVAIGLEGVLDHRDLAGEQ